MATTKDEVRKRAHNFRGANREFSQEMPPLVDGLLELIEAAEGPEVVDSLISNSKTKALSANQGKVLKTLVDAKVDTPESTGEPGQVLQLDANGDPDWVTPTAGTTPDSVMSDDSTNAIQNKVVKKYVDDTAAEKANIDGYYASLVSGAAENLVGHGSVPAEFTFRTSGGDADLGTGTAKITKMKGNSIVWNQLVKNGNFAIVDYWSAPAGGSFSVANNVATVTCASTNGYLSQSGMQLINGHTYLMVLQVKSSSTTIAATVRDSDLGKSYGDAVVTEVDTFQTLSRIFQAEANASNASLRIRDSRSADWDAFYVKNVMVIDLTLMFGAGKEPATVAEFKALYPLLYYAYIAGVIVNNGAAKIKTTGFNQWDEVWELGSIGTSTGTNTPSSSHIRSKNYIPVFPSVTYYNKGYTLAILGYDVDKNFVGVLGNIAEGTFTIPSNVYYIRFYRTATSYANDICINLSWSGYKNGEYQAHWEEEKELNLKTITGVAVGGSESEVIFPEGMRKAGTAYDELVVDSDGWARKAIKRVGNVGLGDLEWTYDGTKFVSASTITGAKASAQVICSKYINASSGDKRVIITTGKYMHVYDSAYSDADTFAAAMDGVGLIYELAEPIEYTLDEPIYMGYRVDDFGTEERLPADTASEVQAPISYEVQYAMNAVDTIRRLPQNYISKSSFDNFCTELSTKLGTALGKTITIATTYNTETQEYDYDITIADAESQSAGGNES